MTKPIQQRTMDRIANDTIGRVRVLEALPGEITWESDGSGAAAATSPVPNKYTMLGPEWDAYTGSGNTLTGGNGSDNFGGSWVYTTDSAAPFGGYVSTTVNDDWMYFGMPLGPRLTGWSVDLWVWNDDDVGKLDIEWATLGVDELASYTLGSAISIIDPIEFPQPTMTWYNTNNLGDLGNSYRIDPYTAGAPSWVCYPARSPIVITGADGDMLSSNGTTPSPDTWTWNKAMNGGGDSSVYWWMRFRVNGKNASSSAYNAKVAAARVVRMNGNGVRVI